MRESILATSNLEFIHIPLVIGYGLWVLHNVQGNQSTPLSCRLITKLFHETTQIVHLVNKCAWSSTEMDLVELTIETRISLVICATKNELDVFCGWVLNAHLNSLGGLVGVFHKSNSSLGIHRV